MHVHRQRGGLSEVRAAETQSAVRIKGRRDFPRKPRSPADGGNGLPGRGVQSLRLWPRRSDGPVALLVKILSPLPARERMKVRVLVQRPARFKILLSDLLSPRSRRRKKGPFNRCSLTLSSSD